MIYEVTYYDQAGNKLLIVTFSADGPREALQLMVSTPTFQPPPGTYDIDISCVNGATSGTETGEPTEEHQNE